MKLPRPYRAEDGVDRAFGIVLIAATVIMIGYLWYQHFWGQGSTSGSVMVMFALLVADFALAAKRRQIQLRRERDASSRR